MKSKKKSYKFHKSFGYVLQLPKLVKLGKKLSNKNYLVKCDPNEDEYKFVRNTSIRTRNKNNKKDYGYQLLVNNQTRKVLTKSIKQKIYYKNKNN